MGRIIVWLMLALASWLAYKTWLGGRMPPRQPGKNVGNQQAGPAANSQAKAGDEAAAVRMLQCAYCGVHVPEPDMVVSNDGRTYCCVEHRDAAFGN